MGRRKKWANVPIVLVMPALLLLSIFSYSVNIRFHVLVGLVVCGLIVFHGVTNAVKYFAPGKIYRRARGRYIADGLLLLAFAAVFFSGLLTAANVLAAGPGRFVHGFSAAAACLLAAVHVLQHRSRVVYAVRRSLGK